MTLKEMADANAAAKVLHDTYVAPLHLTGRSADTALAAMLRAGFKCAVVPAEHIRGIPNEPYIGCERRGEDQGDVCPIFSPSLVVAWPDRSASVAGLLTQLSKAKVIETDGFCPGIPGPSHLEPPTTRTQAEAFLKSGMSAKAAFDRLVGEDFMCGFVRAGGVINVEEMLCTPLRPKKEACRLPQIQLNLKWATTDDDLIESMKAATVQSFQLSCLVYEG